MTTREKEKVNTISRMMDRFIELSNTASSNYTLMSELYNICYEDLVDQLGMVDIEKLSEL